MRICVSGMHMIGGYRCATIQFWFLIETHILYDHRIVCMCIRIESIANENVCLKDNEASECALIHTVDIVLKINPVVHRL